MNEEYITYFGFIRYIALGIFFSMIIIITFNLWYIDFTIIVIIISSLSITIGIILSTIELYKIFPTIREIRKDSQRKLIQIIDNNEYINNSKCPNITFDMIIIGLQDNYIRYYIMRLITTGRIKLDYAILSIILITIVLIKLLYDIILNNNINILYVLIIITLLISIKFMYNDGIKDYKRATNLLIALAPYAFNNISNNYNINLYDICK